MRVKLATLIVGAVLGLVGMRAGNSLLVSLAIGVVLVGVLLRFPPQARADEESVDRSDSSP